MGFRVHVPNNCVLGSWVLLIAVQIRGKDMFTGCTGRVDP